MNRQKRRDTVNRVLFTVTAVLLCALICLTLALVVIISAGSAGSGSFDIDKVKPSGVGQADISKLFVPQFVGVSSAGGRKGLFFPENVITDLYNSVAPAVSYILSEGTTEDGSEADWNGFTDLESYVYVRLHTQLPETVVRMFGDLVSDTAYIGNSNRSDVLEMFIIPYSESADEAKLATRSADGTVTVYTAKDPRIFLSEGEIEKIFKTYSSSLCRFEFARDGFASFSYSEPIMLDASGISNIITTNGTAQIVFSSPYTVNALLKVFGMNPEKAVENQTEDGRDSYYIDPRGVLYIRDSSFEYRATSDGGITIADLTGQSKTAFGAEDYIRATCAIFSRIRDIRIAFTGGEAGTVISGFSSARGVVTVEMLYCFDNIPLSGIQPAVKAVYENGSLKEAVIYTLSAHRRNDKTTVMSQYGFASNIDMRGIGARFMVPVYKTDFLSESVRPEWSAKVMAQ